MITKNWNRLQITLNQVNILNWRESHQFFPNSFWLVIQQSNKRWRREKVTTTGLQNLAFLVRLYSGGQWTIAEAKLESSLCLEIYTMFPFPLCYFIPRCYFKCNEFKNIVVCPRCDKVCTVPIWSMFQDGTCLRTACNIRIM